MYAHMYSSEYCPSKASEKLATVPRSRNEKERLSHDWLLARKMRQTSEEEVQKYFGTITELEVSKIVLTDAKKDVNEEHSSISLYQILCPVEGSTTGFMYSSSADSMKNFVSHCVLSLIFEDMNTAPSQTLLDETRRIVLACEEYPQRFMTVCNQFLGSRKKSARDRYSQKSGYRFLAKAPIADCDTRFATKKVVHIEDAFSKLFELNSCGERNISW